MNPEPNDLEYQRFGETAHIHTVPREFKLFVLSVVVLLVDIMCIIGTVASFYWKIIHHDYLWNSVILLAVSFLGLFLLGNGLFGNKNRGKSLAVYVFVFQLLPTAISVIMFVVSLIYIKKIMDEFRKEWPAADPVALAIYTEAVFAAYIVYRLSAAMIVHNYKKAERVRNPDF